MKVEKKRSESLSMKKAKILTSIGKIYGFTPTLNGSKFPTYKQVENYLDKKATFININVQDKKTLTDNSYRLKNAEARDLSNYFDKHPKQRWHDGLTIEVHYTLNKNGLHVVQSAQKYVPPKKLTKAEKKSLANQRTKEAKQAKSQAKSTAVINSQRNSIMAQVAGLQQSAIYMLSSHQKKISQVKQEFNKYKQSISNLITPDSTLFDLSQVEQGAQNMQNTPTSTANDMDLESDDNNTIKALASRAKIQTSTQSVASSALVNTHKPIKQSDAKTKAKAKPELKSITKKHSKTKHQMQSSKTNRAKVAKSKKAYSGTKASQVSSNNSKQSMSPQAKSIAQIKSQVAKLKQSQAQLAKSKQAVQSKKASQAVSASNAKMMASKRAQAQSKAQIKRQAEAKQSASNSMKAVKEAQAKLHTSAVNEMKRKKNNHKAQQSKATQSTKSAEVSNQNKKEQTKSKLHRTKISNNVPTPALTHLNHLMRVHNSVQEQKIQQSYQHILNQPQLNHNEFRKAIHKIYQEEHWDEFFKNNEKSAQLQIGRTLNKMFNNPAVKYSQQYNKFPNMNDYMAMTKIRYQDDNNSNSLNNSSDINKEPTHDVYDSQPQSDSSQKLNQEAKQNNKNLSYKHKSEQQLVAEDKKAHERLKHEKQKLEEHSK